MTTINDYLSTPGEILKEEFLIPMGVSQYRLAKAIGKPESAISEIVNDRRAISVEMSYLLGAALGTSPQYWLNLQRDYDLLSFDRSRIPKVVALA